MDLESSIFSDSFLPLKPLRTGFYTGAEDPVVNKTGNFWPSEGLEL